MKNWFKMPRNMKDILIILAVIGVIATSVWYFFFRTDDQAAIPLFLTSPMRRMTLQDTISGSGNIIANESAEIRNAVAGQVAEIFIQNGDYVSKGQPLYRLTNDTLITSLQQAQLDLANAQNNYDKLLMQTGNSSGQLRDAQLKVEQRQIALDSQIKNRENLNVYAMETGKITDINVKLGDNLSANTAIFGFYSEGKEKQNDYQIKLQQAKANYDNKLKDYEKLVISVDFAGTVKDLSVKPGDIVAANDLLMSVQDTNKLATSTSSETILKLQQAELTLNNRQTDVENLEVKASITGLVSGLNASLGDSVSASTNLATLADNRQVIIKVNVPQSFINGVARGNKATVLMSSSARSFEGRVTDVSPTGTQDSSSGVVSYPVEITIDNDGSLLAGMSALVDIASSDATFRSVSSLRGTVANEVNKTVNPKVSGEIIELRAKNGDWVLEGQVIAVLKNDSVDLALRQAEEDLKKLQQDEFRAPAMAVVKEVLVSNDSRVQPGQTLIVLQSDAIEAAYLQAKLDYESILNRTTGNTDVRNKTAGVLNALYVKEGDIVQEGQLLAELSSSDILYQEQRALTDLEQARAELQALIINTSAGELQLASLKLDQAALTVTNRQKEVDDLIVKALVSGNVTQRIKPVVGDEFEKSTLLGTIYDYSSFKLVVNVDELEIPRIEIGTKASVTVDAFEGRFYEAIVDEISNEGSVAQGGSTYPVTIQFTANDPLRAAMTATATIVLEEAVDTFAVISSAVTTLGVGPNATYRVQILPEGSEDPVWREVTVGMKTRSMIEILSGVTEGERVVTGIVDAATGNFTGIGGMNVMGPGVSTGTVRVSPGTSTGGNVVMMPAGGR